MRIKSIAGEAKEIQLAIELIKLGARLQLLETEVNLSRERLLKLYKEIRKESPPKGMLPFSTDWFMTWQPNIHASVFMNMYKFLTSNSNISGVYAIMKSYRLYVEHVEANGLEQVLSLTRAWTLVRFFDAKMVQLTACTRCRGHFVTHTDDLTDDYVCGLCHIPSRAGKTRKAAELEQAALVS